MHIKKDSIYLLMHSGYFSWQHKYYYVDKGVLDFFTIGIILHLASL